MSIFRRTLCALVVAGAPFGSLVVATAAQAAPGDPGLTVTSVEVNGPHLHGALAAGNGLFYTNDPINLESGLTVDGFTVTVHGDPSGSLITLAVLDADRNPVSDLDPVAPDAATGEATFDVGSLPAGIDTFAVFQTVGGEPQTSQNNFVQVGNPGSLTMSDGDVVAVDSPFYADGIPNEPVQLFVDGTDAGSATATDSGFAQVQPTEALTADYHTAYLKTIDSQNQVSDQSDTVGFYVKPPAPHIASPACHSVFGPCYVNHTDPRVTVSGIEDGATVKLVELTHGGEDQETVDTATDVEGGTVDLTATATLGEHRYLVLQSVNEGEGETFLHVQSEQSDIVDLDVETAAPELSASTWTNDSMPALFFDLPAADGSSHEGAKVRIIDATTGLSLGEASLNEGMWRPSAPLADGQYSMYAVAIDDFGHVGTEHSNTVSFTVNTTPPVMDGPQFGDGPQEGDDAPAPSPVSKPTPVIHTTNQPTPKPTDVPAAPKSVKVSSSTLTDSKPVKLAFTVSKAGTVTLTLTTKVHGKTKVVGTVTIKVTKAGKVSYTLKTKFAGHKLGKGSYTLNVQSVSGKHKSKTVSVSLKVSKSKH